MRRVFFSFHYDRDVRRIQQVRQSWVVRPQSEAQPFYDAAGFEEAKRRAGGVELWIEQQLKGVSVTAVLFGHETHTRPWVKHELKRSYELGKGLLAIDIHKVKDPQTGADRPGRNPLLDLEVYTGGRKVPASQVYPTFDWVDDNGYANIAAWVEAAAKAAGR